MTLGSQWEHARSALFSSDTAAWGDSPEADAHKSEPATVLDIDNSTVILLSKVKIMLHDFSKTELEEYLILERRRPCSRRRKCLDMSKAVSFTCQPKSLTGVPVHEERRVLMVTGLVRTDHMYQPVDNTRVGAINEKS